MKTNNPYTPFDEQLREQLASLNPEVPEGVWEAMESSLDALNQNLQFDAAIRETVEHINIPAPEGVFQAVQSQLGSGILGHGLSIAGKWIIGSVLAGVVATSVWYVTDQKGKKEGSDNAAVSTLDQGTDKMNDEGDIIPDNLISDKQAVVSNVEQSVSPVTVPYGQTNPVPPQSPANAGTPPPPPQSPANAGTPQPQPQPEPQAQPQPPVFGFSNKDTMLCVGQSYKLFLLHADNCVYEVWINGSCLSKGIKGNLKTEYPMTTSGLYHVECRILEGENIHKKAQFVYINPLPEVKLSKTDMGGGRYSFEATEGDKTSWYLDGGKMANGSIQLYDALPKDHRMTAQVTNKLGCTDSASLEFRNNFVFEVKEPIIPNVFTPNGDGSNDVYKIEIEGVTHYHIRIYNNKTQLVFESNDPKAAWDGKDKYKENRIEPGMYTYFIDYALAGGEIKHLTNTITLIKE
ncbi:MAG: gliding motility-associated C-terminal domain-containing protein [Bacteroidia bacterium]